MNYRKPIDYLTIKGFKSIKNMEHLELCRLNVLIGSNGSGKSNFVSYFRMMDEMMNGRLQKWIALQGGADRILFLGPKETKAIESVVGFEQARYEFKLVPSVSGEMVFEVEVVLNEGNHETNSSSLILGQQKEAGLATLQSREYQEMERMHGAISNWKVFHFLDTSDHAGVKREGALHDNEYLRSDASNLAAYLYKLREADQTLYNEIRDIIRLAIPFFDDFVLRPNALKTGENLISLQWRQRNSDYPMWPSQLSDGSIRFICLVVALLQMEAPETIIIDEPELGLHPYAITLLGSLLKSASEKMQVIVSTQSVSLVNEFSIDNLIVVERDDDATVFKRVSESDFILWLEDYSPGELWQKNILGGRPPR